MLWGRAGGRCEFAGSNLPLWRSPVTQESVNVAQRAHIYSFSSDGPREKRLRQRGDLYAGENLLLVCPICHLKIDRAPDGGRYTARALQEMKAKHELRIEVVTGIDADRRSHVLLYGANIGEHASPRLMTDAATAMFPSWYPALATPISLGSLDSPTQDRSDEFWKAEAATLRCNSAAGCGSGFRPAKSTTCPCSPSPHSRCSSCSARCSATSRRRTCISGTASRRVGLAGGRRHPGVRGQPAGRNDGPPALVLAISATVTRDRIEAVLGPSVSVWQITVELPHNDLTKSREQLGRFRAILRTMLDRIKAAHGQTTPLHIFPVASVAMAVEFGRVRMPKADTPWHVYDQVNARGGFIHALIHPQRRLTMNSDLSRPAGRPFSITSTCRSPTTRRPPPVTARSASGCTAMPRSCEPLTPTFGPKDRSATGQ